MANHKKEVKKLLEPLFYLFHKRFFPASEKCLVGFRERAVKRKIPDSVVEQLTDLYQVTNGVPNLDDFIFHRCGDKNLFEWWNEKEELWLGSRENDVLRWTSDRFCLGDTNTTSYSTDYEFPTLTELLEKCFEKWYLGLWDRFVETNNEIELWRAKAQKCQK